MSHSSLPWAPLCIGTNTENVADKMRKKRHRAV